jgi:hypothetical protein
LSTVCVCYEPCQSSISLVVVAVVAVTDCYETVYMSRVLMGPRTLFFVSVVADAVVGEADDDICRATRTCPGRKNVGRPGGARNGLKELNGGRTRRREEEEDDDMEIDDDNGPKPSLDVGKGPGTGARRCRPIRLGWTSGPTADCPAVNAEK